MSIQQLRSYLDQLSLADQDQLEAELAFYQAQKVEERIEAAKKSSSAANSLLVAAIASGEVVAEFGKQIQKSFNKAITANQVMSEQLNPVCFAYLKNALAFSNKEALAYANLFAQITLKQAANAAFSTRDLEIREDYFIGFSAEQLKEKGIKQPGKSITVSDDAKLVDVFRNIGKDIEMSIKIAALKEFDGLAAYKVFRNNLKDPLYGDAYAKKQANKVINDVDGFEWQAFTEKQCVYLGAFLLDTLISDSIYAQNKKKALFTVQLIQYMNDAKLITSQYFLLPAASVEKKADELIAIAQSYAMLRLPMTVPPTDWSQTVYGGYKSNELTMRDKLVRRKDGNTVFVPEEAFATLNKLQSVGYVVNDFVLSNLDGIKAKLLETKQGTDQPTIGKFVPALPGLKRYQSRKTVRTESVIACAEKFSGTVFYSPYSFDYRGRMYPLTSVLQPQGTDFEKALLKFADAQPLTESGVKWLKIQIANCAGYDKSSYAERVQFVDDNIDLITAVATDPVGNLAQWQYTSEPWQFLAACEEYYACCISKTRSESNLLVAVDATCSGIQILAGITKDADAAALVNVTPSDAPQDAYAAVAEAAVKSLLASKAVPTKVAKLLNRKVAKKLVMTVPYNAQKNTNYSQVADALKEAAAEAKKQGKRFTMPSREEQQILASALIDAMSTVIAGPMAFNKWLNTAAFKLASQLNGECLTWLSPSGFEVMQNKNKLDTISVKPQFAESRKEIKLAVGFTDEANTSGHRTATMPNMIHSVDAAVLQLAFATWQKPLALIHDSAIGNANDIDEIQAKLRQAYVDIFAGDSVNKMLSQFIAVAAEPMPAPKTVFNTAEVLKSDYFFC
jgi:DNA-directed RNA polymerase